MGHHATNVHILYGSATAVRPIPVGVEPTTPGLRDVRYFCCSIPPDTFLEHPVQANLGHSCLAVLLSVAAL